MRVCVDGLLISASDDCTTAEEGFSRLDQIGYREENRSNPILASES